jgi:hypothetical protein
MVRWAATGLLAATATISLTACRDHGLDSAPAGTAPVSAVSSASVPAATSAPATAATPAAPAAQAAQSAALAQVSADLSGVNAGVSQAGTDLGAGDSARTQPDDGN